MDFMKAIGRPRTFLYLIIIQKLFKRKKREHNLKIII